MLTSYYIHMDPAYSDMLAASIGRSPRSDAVGTPYQTKLTFLANLLTILRILLQWKLDYDNIKTSTRRTRPAPARSTRWSSALSLCRQPLSPL